LQAEDTECTAGGGTMVALKATADPELVGILGTNCSVAAIPTSRIMSEAGLSMISGANTLPSLTSIGGEQGSDWQPGYFRTVYNDVDQGRVAATFAFAELGARRAAVVNDGDPYTHGLTDVFAQMFTELGGEVVISTGVNKGDTNMGPVLTAVATARSEILFAPIFHPEASHVMVQGKEFSGLEHTAFMTTFKKQSFLDAVGPAGIGVYLVGPTTPKGDAYNGLVTRYESKYGELPVGTYHAQTYDAANLMLSTIAAVAIQEEDGTLHIGRQALRDALYQTRDFQGLTGSLGCDEFGDCGADRFDIVQVEDPTTGLEGLTKNVVYSHGREDP
jgi:branched-chain amino acid transport system substrate-binding protein